MPIAYISLGSNVNAADNICAAIIALKIKFNVCKMSTVYKNKAIGFDGDDFLNLVVEVETNLSILDFVDTLHKIEVAQGRIRESEKFSPRTLDMDLLLYDNDVFESPSISIPRDEITRYAFVLLPLSELIPNYSHPTLDKTISQIWSSFDKSNVQMTSITLPL